MTKKMFVSFLLVLLSINAINCIVCNRNSCNNVKCKNVTRQECNKPNQDLRKGGWCNCCIICFTTLGENEPCRQSHAIGVPSPTSACGDELECIQGTCVPRTF
ncbi:hypothetical protein HHI36_008013 [Cryptolaemus montrouzieri]|uniref:Uncharacterized protein n=1 Tax=Cryptolaemus montrouzieri TaxID=559131 RepID=A0ABD2MR84_9CUCU